MLGSQSPDFIDKFLAWYVSVLPSARSLGHSVIGLFIVSWIVLRIAERYDRPTLGIAFGVAYASHLVSDAISPIFSNDLHELGYFLWPITPAPYTGSGSILDFIHSASLAYFTGYHAVAIVLCIGLWLLDGAPGLRPPNWRKNNSE